MWPEEALRRALWEKAWASQVGILTPKLLVMFWTKSLVLDGKAGPLGHGPMALADPNSGRTAPQPRATEAQLRAT